MLKMQVKQALGREGVHREQRIAVLRAHRAMRNLELMKGGVPF